jgi:deoxyribodipyrimidine photo-lyase
MWLMGEPGKCSYLARQWQTAAVFANRDYEPQAIQRDAEISRALEQDSCTLQLFKDQVIFESNEVLTGTCRPYTVFTPYKNAWLKNWTVSFKLPHSALPASA